MLTIDGLISGIDTEAIIDGLLNIQQTQIDRLGIRRQELQARKAAYDSLDVQLATFQSIADRLARSHNSVFFDRSVAVSEESALLVSAENEAALGTYQITVDELARAHQVASQGFADTDATITEGTLTLQVGAGDAVTITIDSTNNTLQGLADAINDADAGLSATTVSDGTASRLLLTANETGLANEIQITNNLGATAGLATQPTFDLGNPVQAAADAEIRLGSGPGAITVAHATNTITDVIEGVTLDLLAADAGKPIQVKVTNSTESASATIHDFVDSFNGIMNYSDELVRYNPETDQAGLLNGDRAITDIQNDLRAAVLDVVPDLSPTANRLSVLGISLNDQGRLAINEGRLQDALSGRIDGISANDLRSLFSFDASSTHNGVEFLLDGFRPQAGVSSYSVDITQVAERATILGDTPLAASTTFTALDNTLDLTVDGVDISITLAIGTYTPQELVSLLESEINSSSELNGRTVSATLDGSGQLQLTSNAYGSSSQVTILGGTATTLLGLSSNPTDFGQNVAGSFTVNGVTEAASGNGRILSGLVNNQYTAGLKALVTLAAGDLVAGPEAEVTVTTGLATQWGQLTRSITNIESGDIAAVQEGYEIRLRTLDETITRQEELFARQRDDLVAQFVALESAISELQTTSSFLAAQLTGLQQLRPNVSR
ncbi:MAG: flagellar filament capping protein FliD [Planctomycetaceae bacterium]|nr:flagellar filament capping protein FliD [Planctomycetaceae bacterium]